MYSSTPIPEVHLRSSTQRFITVESMYQSLQDDAPGAFRFRAFDGRVAGATIAGVPVSGALSSADQDALMGAFAPLRAGAPWERPLLRPIPDPAGPDWQANRASSSDDHTAYLQSLIDTQGIAQVAAGTYYISQPLSLKQGQGLVGAGASRTVIIAKNDIDLIHGAEVNEVHPFPLYATRFVLADLTLQGGRNGIHHDKYGSGGGAQYNMIDLSHVTFRDMSEAGIFIDGIMAWDNNLIDEVNFVRCKAGLKQRVDPAWVGGDNPGMSYLDKNVFYRAQFVESDIALDMQGNRGSFGNHFINSSFRDNGQTANLINWASTVFANSEFINNGGAPTLKQNYFDHAGGVYVVASRFQAGARGLSMLGYGTTCEGCTFELSGSTSATVVSAGARAFFYNSASVDMPMGSLAEGFSVNSAWPRDATMNQKAILLTPTGATTLVPGTPTPAPQLLFGVPWY